LQQLADKSLPDFEGDIVVSKLCILC